MTEAIPIDVSSKIISNPKPAVPAALGASKPPDKPGSKGPAGDDPGAPPPAPGSKTFLGWVASGFSRKQLTIALAAACSLAAGIAAVRLIWPDEEPPSTTTALLTEPRGSEAASSVPPRSAPTVILEQPKPAEFIPPAALPMPSATVPSSGSAIPPPSGLDTLPAIPLAGSSPAAAASSGGHLGPLSPASPASAPRSTASAIPAPDSLVPAVVPASGTDNKPVPPSSGSLPMIPTTPSSVLPTAPLLPTLPGTPSITPSGNPEPKPPAPIAGMPPKPPESLAPSVETTPKLPAPPVELSPKLPAVPGSEGAKPGAEKIEFVKPAESSTAAPATRPPTTSYDVDIYHPKANDSWESISREYFSDTRYAAALRAYNQNRALTPGREVDVPPLHVLRRMNPQPAPVAGAPTGRVTPASGTDPWNAAGGSGAKIYRVPPGDGMSLPAVAKLVLGNDQRWQELYELNPNVNPGKVPAGTELKLPADARVQ
jgi:hypothetical protein